MPSTKTQQIAQCRPENSALLWTPHNLDFRRSVGKHIVMGDGSPILTIPRHNPVNEYTMGGIVRDAGLTIEKFKKPSIAGAS